MFNTKKYKIKNYKKGISLVEVLVGTFVATIIFVAIMGVFRSSIELTINNKMRLGALTYSQSRMESMLGLDYDNVGTIGGIPVGNIPQNESVSLNGVNYNIRTLIQYVDDPADGEDGDDENGITADYKRIKIEVSWDFKGNTRETFLAINRTPEGIETLFGGGTLIAQVFDAVGLPIVGADVHIVNNSLVPSVDVNVLTNTGGKVMFPGSPANNNYEITVSKSGYSTAQTYENDEGNQNPQPGHLSVLEGNTTVQSFQIELLSDLTINAFYESDPREFEDLFNDGSKIDSSASTTVSSGVVELENNGGYEPVGNIESITIHDLPLESWDEFSWNDVNTINTNILYRVLYSSGSGIWENIPDVDLGGNSAGFNVSPVNLFDISTTTYNELRVSAELQTSNVLETPQLEDWEVSYVAGPFPAPNIDFDIVGDKVTGADGGGVPIYKYNVSTTTNSGGNIFIDDLEWDNYDISFDIAESLDISASCDKQPVVVDPDTSVINRITLSPSIGNYLLISVENTSGNALNNATVRLYNGGSYDETVMTSGCGQAHFNSAGGGDYDLDISLGGYDAQIVEDIDVSSTNSISVILVN